MHRAHRVSPIHFLVPLAAGVAMASFAAAQAEPAAAVETAYLAILGTAVLLPFAVLAVRPDLQLGLPALLVTAAAWVIPAGPTRGAAITLLLLFALGVAMVGRQIREGSRLVWSVAVPAVLALQLLIRADRLLTPGLDGATLIGLIALPVAAGTAMLILARDRDAWIVLVAAAAAVVLAPGFNVSVTLSLLVVAAADLTREPALRRLGWVGVAVVVGLAIFWQPPLGLLLAAVAAAHRLAGNWLASAAVAGVVTVAAILLPAARSGAECVEQLSLLPLLLPAALFAVRDRPATLILATVLAAVGLRIVPDSGALAAPAVLIALALRPQGTAWELQRLWSGLAVAGTTLFATYPWMRQEPLTDALELVGLAPGWLAALVLVSVVLALGLGWEIFARRRPAGTAHPIGVALALVGLAVYASLPAVGERPIGERPEVLRGEHPRFDADLSTVVKVSEVVVDSYLTDAAELPTGTPVADVRLTGEGGTRWTWTLQAGVDTAEWAAQRDNVASVPGFVAPPPWLSRVASEGDIFAQRYRSRSVLESPIEVDHLAIVRRDALPETVSIAIFHLELRP